MAEPDYLFAGTYGHVLALDKATGEAVWNTSLPGTGYSVVSIVLADGNLFCASGGRVFALDPQTGDIVWENGLPGMGMGLVYLTTARTGNPQTLTALAAQEQANQHAHGAHGATM